MATVQEAIRRLTIEATTRGVREAEQAARGLATAMDGVKAASDGVAVSTQKTEKATQSVEGAFQRSQRRYDAAVRGQQEFLRVLKLVNAAENQNIGTQQERLALLQSVASAVERQAAAVGRLGGQFDLATPVAKSAQESASVFAKELDRLDEIARMKAQQAGATFAAELDARMVAGAARSARESASVFAAELDRLDDIARMKAEQAGRNFQAGLDASFGIGGQSSSARASASVFEEAARESEEMEKRVSALRAQINPLNAALDRMNAELAEYSSMAANGAISAGELAQGQALARARYEATTAAINQQAVAIAKGARAFQTSNLASQGFDILSTAAFMPWYTVALQQGPQVAMVFNDIRESGSRIGPAVAAAFMQLVNPISLVTIGVIAAGAALVQWATSGEDGVDKLNDAMRTHEELISRLKERYGEAAAGIKAYIQESASELARAARQVEEANRSIVTDAAKAAVDELRSVSADLLGRSTPLFGDFVGSLNMLEDSLKANNPALLEFRQRMIEIEKSEYATDQQKQLASALIATTDAGYQAARALPQAGQEISDVAARAAGGVSSVISFASALIELGNQIPNVARAQRAQADMQKNVALFESQKARLDRQVEMGSLGTSAYEQQMAKLTERFQEAQTEASGLGDNLRRLQDAERQAQIGGMQGREADVARIRDRYTSLINDLKEVGGSEQDIARATSAMNAELATSSRRFDEMAAKAGSRGAAKALKEAERDLRSFVSIAERLSERMFPGDAARREAEELTAQLDQYGDKLTDIQRIAVETRIADQFEAARLGVRELEKDTQSAAKQMAEDLQGTLGSVLSDLFTTPMEDLDEFVDSALSAFARLASANLERGLEGLFNGKGIGAASDNDAWNSGGLNLRSVTRAIEDGARKGSADGSAYGTTTGLGALSGLFSGKNGQMMSAGLGGLGMGYESGNAISGGLGGALSGFLSGGGPLGAIVGGLGGILGGIFGRSRQKKQEQKQARDELESNMGAIRDLIDAAMGTPSGSYESAWRDMSDEIAKARKLAKKAGDSDLVAELDLASQTFFDFLVQDWQRGLDGVIKAMESGHGMDSAFVRAQEAVVGLQDTLLGFVEDAKFFAETDGDLDKAKLTKAANDNSTTGSVFKSVLDDPKRYFDPISDEYRKAAERYKDELKKLDISAILTTGTGKDTREIAAYDSVDALMKRMRDLGVVFDDLGNVLTADQIKDRIDAEKELQKAIAAAQEAAQQMALRQLTGAEEFTAIELEIQRLEGTAAGLQTTLEKLGMTADEAADAIEKGLTEALDKLRKSYVDDLSRSLNELSGAGYINDVTDAMKLYEQRLKDSKALGIDSSMALTELTLALKQISTEAGLSGKDLEYLAKLFPDLASIFKGISPTGGIAEAQAAVDRAKADLRAAYDEEARAIEATIGRLKSFISSIEDFKASLKLDSQLSPLSPTDRLIEAQKRFQEISQKALAGDEAAMGQLEDVSRQYLTEARAYYASSEQYFQIFEQVEAILDQALTSAKGQLSLEERSLSTLEDQVSKLIDINDSVLTVAAAIAGLQSAISALDGLGGGQGFDASTYWSKSLKDFYGQLQAYKKEAGTDVAPSQIASVWKAFASAGSGAEYDLLARAYTEILKGLMPKSGMRLGGIVGAYANGGIVGNGIYDMDSVIARYAGGGDIALAGGEFVTRARSVNSRTSPTLDYINRTGSVPGNDNAVAAEIRALRAEVAAFRAERRTGDDITVAGVKVVEKAITEGTDATIDVGRRFGKQDLRRPA